MSGGNPAALRLHLGLVYLFLYGPIVVLVALSFNQSGLPTTWTGFSTDWYVKLAANGPLLATLANSLIVAAATTGDLDHHRHLCSPWAWRKSVGRPHWKQSSPRDDHSRHRARGGAAVVLHHAEFHPGLWSIVISHAVFNIAYVVAVVPYRLRNFDRSIVEASIDLGASEIAHSFQGRAAVIAPGVIAAALISFTLSFDEFIIAYFTGRRRHLVDDLPDEGLCDDPLRRDAEINAIATIVTAHLLPRVCRPAPAT